MSQKHTNNDDVHWKEGDICYRKGERFKIKKIDHTTNPASVIIESIVDGREINTEFSRLARPKNDNNNDKKSIPHKKKQLTPSELRKIRKKKAEERRKRILNASEQRIKYITNNETAENLNKIKDIDKQQNDNFAQNIAKNINKLNQNNINDPRNMLYHCSGNHPLTKYIVTHWGVACNACMKVAIINQSMHGCRTCDYDLCVECNNNNIVLSKLNDNKDKDKNKNDNITTLQCNNGHNLQYIIPPYFAGFICNLCKIRYNKNVKCYHCGWCNYDVCTECNNKHSNKDNKDNDIKDDKKAKDKLKPLHISPNKNNEENVLFFMYSYKTKQCTSNTKCLNVISCSGWHKEEERRRDPGRAPNFNYSHKACTRVKVNKWLSSKMCQDGDKCKYSHNLLEQLYHPNMYKTSLCNNYQNKNQCHWGYYCTNAHSKDQLRVLDLKITSDQQKKEDAKKKKLALKIKLKQKILYYRNIVTKGCGHGRCTNPYCKSNIDNEDKEYTPAEASKLALKMIKTKTKNCNEYVRRDLKNDDQPILRNKSSDIDQKDIVPVPVQLKHNTSINDDDVSSDILKFKRKKANRAKEANVVNKIRSASTAEDLLPYIKLLVPISELRNILINKYNKINYNMGNINKLYLKSSPIQEILFDNLIIKIIKYLDYKQYNSINLLSKYFNKIMKKSVSIYNKYTLHIICNKELWDSDNIEFVLNHHQKLLAIEAGFKRINNNKNQIQTKRINPFFNPFNKRLETKKYPNDIIKIINNNNISSELYNSFFDWFNLKKLLIDYHRIPQIQKQTQQQQHGQQPNNAALNNLGNLFNNLGGVLGAGGGAATGGAQVLGNIGQVFTGLGGGGGGAGVGGNRGRIIGYDDDKYSDKQIKMFNIFLKKIKLNIVSLTIRNIRNLKLFQKHLNLNQFPKLFHLRLDLNINYKILSYYNFSKLLSLELYDVLQMKEKEDYQNFYAPRVRVQQPVQQQVVNNPNVMPNAFGQQTGNVNNPFGALFGGINNVNNANNPNKKENDNDNIGNILNMIFKNCNNLLSFYCSLLPQASYSMRSGLNSNKKMVLFPSTLQFIFLAQYDTWFDIDLSACNNLITLGLLGNNNSVNINFNSLNISKIENHILWPKKEINCLILQQIAPINRGFRQHNNTLLPNYINHFYKYLQKCKVNKYNYNNKPNIRFIKYLTMPKLVDSNQQTQTQQPQPPTQPQQIFNAWMGINQQQQNINQAAVYDPINQNNEETITISEMNEWTKSIDIQSLLSLRNKFLIIKNIDNLNEYDLWKILIKLSNLNKPNNYIKIYKSWFDIDINLWIKTMFKSAATTTKK